MKHLLSLLSLSILATPVSGQETPTPTWFEDFDQACAAAAEQGKDLLVDFTGSDWCGWCIRLDEEVFEHEAFFGPISEGYVLLKLDFPNGEEIKSKVPNPERNAEISEKYSVNGFPTILLMNHFGEVFASTGYQEGGPESYVKHLDEIATAGKKTLAVAKEIQDEYETNKDKEAVIRKAMMILTESDEGAPGRTVFAGIIRKGYEIDPENASGLKLACVETLLANGQADSDDLGLAAKMDTENELGLLEKVVLGKLDSVRDDSSAAAAVLSLVNFQSIGKVHDSGKIQEAALMAAFWCNSERMLNEPEKAKSLAKWAKTLGEIPKDFQELVEELVPELQFRDGSCCDRAAKKGGVCGHPCCKKAAQEGEVCSKCN
jgi:thioredoxin-related protein